MVALELVEPLLLYIMATTDAVSMVLVAERPNPKTEEAPGSQTPLAHPTLKLCDGVDTVVECHLLDANPSAANQEVTVCQLLGAISDSGGQEPLEPEPMEVDAPDPPREGSDCPATSLLH
jgi:hypothetical protein